MKTNNFTSLSINEKGAYINNYSTTRSYTVSAVLQVYEYIYTEYLSSFSKNELKNRLQLWERNNQQIVKGSVRLGSDFVSFDDCDDLLRIIDEYEETFEIFKAR